MEKPELNRARRMNCSICNTRLKKIIPFGKRLPNGSVLEVGFKLHCCQCGMISTHYYSVDDEGPEEYLDRIDDVNDYIMLPPICAVPSTGCDRRKKCPATAPSQYIGMDRYNSSVYRKEGYGEEAVYHKQKKYL